MIINYILAIAVIASALLFAYPILLFRKIYGFENKGDYRTAWFFLSLLSVTFFVGYTLFAVYILRLVGEASTSDVIAAAFLMGGSIFATVVAWLFYQMVFSLDNLVQERTSELEKVHVKAIETEHETQRLKDHFIFVAAHEIRTPVTAMRWCLELIGDVERHQLSSGKLHEIIGKLEMSLSNLVALVDDLLDTSRLEYGTIKLNMGNCIIGEVLGAAVELIKPIADREGVALSVDFGELNGKKVIADSRRLGEVLTNLISNSIKFTESGGSIKISLAQQGDDYVISVADTGIGLNEEDMGKLFQKFSRPDNHPVGKQIQSTGLGLYIARTLVECWGGRIWAESSGRGKGSTFSFTVSA